MNEDIKENMLSTNQWLRILLMVGFVILSWLLRFGQLAVIVIQALFALITGRDNANMRKAGTLLALYQAQIWLYLSYSTNIRPYPFSDLPESGKELGIDVDDINDDDEDHYEREAAPSPRASAGSRQSGTGGDDVFSDISFTSGTSKGRQHGDDIPTVDDADSKTTDADDRKPG